MKIAIDISQLSYQGTGVARYTQNLVESLIKYDDKNRYVFFYSSLRKPIPEKIRKLIIQKHTLRQFPLPPTALDLLWNKWHKLPIERFVGDVDIVFTSDWTEPPTAKAKKITTIHDLAAFRFPETSHDTTEFKLSRMQISANIVANQKRKLDYVRKESNLIICDSHATREDVEELLKIPKNKLVVVYPAVEVTVFPEEKKIADKPYILTVGTLQPRKNIKRLINAFIDAKLPIDLYIVGAQGWGEELPSNTAQNIKFLGYAEDKQLSQLYQNALFFIYPSLYEGFGYPVVEAMAYGCPVATSNTSSLKEIADGYGVLFDPESEKDIEKALTKLYLNEKLRKALINKGYKRAEEFSGKHFAKQLISIFENVYGNRS